MKRRMLFRLMPWAAATALLPVAQRSAPVQTGWTLTGPLRIASSLTNKAGETWHLVEHAFGQTWVPGR